MMRIIAFDQGGHRASTSAALLAAIPLLLMLALPAVASAGSIVCFVDAQHGWYSGWDGSYDASSQATVWRTVNQGATWKPLTTRSAAFTSGGVWGGGFFAFATRTTGIWVRASHAVLRTTNAGATWHSVRVAPKWHWLNDASFATSRVGWACSERGSAGEQGSIAKTTNAGATWRIQKRFAVSHGTYFLRVSCPNARTCYVLGMDPKGQCVWATADGGKHWTRRRLPGGTYWTSFDFPTAATGWVVGWGGSIAKTVNAGRTWQGYGGDGAADDFQSVSFCNSKVGYAVGSLGLCERTTDGGATWTPSGAFPAYSEDYSLVAVEGVDRTHAWVADSYGAIYETADGGNSWQESYLDTSSGGE